VTDKGTFVTNGRTLLLMQAAYFEAIAATLFGQANFRDEQGNFSDGQAKVRGRQVNLKTLRPFQIGTNPLLPRE
jgi:hypothetical protein